MKKRSFLFAGLVMSIAVSAPLYAEVIRPVTTADQSHPFVRLLEAQYDAYLQAGRRGDVEAYKRTRTTEQIVSMEAHLKRTNKLDQFGAIIKEMASYSHDYRKFQFIACDTANNRARLSYMRESEYRDATNKPRVEFLIVMFDLEKGSWKIGYIGHMNVPGTHEDGTLASLSDFKDREKFRLP